MSNEKVDFVVIDAHAVVRDGLKKLLADHKQVQVVGAVESIAELKTFGSPYDACVLELGGIGDDQEIRDLMSDRRPAVVYTAARAWHYWVMAWVCGAKGVVGKSMGAESVGNAVWTACNRPQDIQPQLALALINVVRDYAVPLSRDLNELLRRIADREKTESVLRDLDLAEDKYIAALENLRQDLKQKDLHVVLIPDLFATETTKPANSPTPIEYSEEWRSLTDRERQIVEEIAKGLRKDEIAQKLNISELTVRSHLTSAMGKLGIRRKEADVVLQAAVHASGQALYPDSRRYEVLKALPPRRS